jgi:predicted  nucleic acid-binding Zn-ribbon protein
MSDLVIRLTAKVASQAQELASLSEALKSTKQEADNANTKLIELTTSLSKPQFSSSFSKSSSASVHSKKTKDALIQEISNYEKKLHSKTSQITKLINELGNHLIRLFLNNIIILYNIDIKTKSYESLEKNYNDILYNNMKLTANGNSNVDIEKLLKELDDAKNLIELLKKDIKMVKAKEEESSMKMKLLEDAIMLKTNDISTIGISATYRKL